MEASSSFTRISEVEKKDPTGVYTAAIFALTFALIGFPLWWKTTNVYRVALPYEEIEKLSTLKLSHLVPVTVVLADRDIHQRALWEELYSESNGQYQEPESNQLKVQYAWKMRTALEEEEAAINRSQNLAELDELLDAVNDEDEIGVYHVFVLERKTHFPQVTTRLVGCHRRGYLYVDPGTSLGKGIISVVKTMAQTDLLKKIYSPPSSSYERRKPEKDRMRSLSATVAFDITFSLVVPEPHIIDVHWDIESAVNAYIMPFVSRLSLIADVDIKSQILYMTSLPIKTSLRGENGEQYLSPDLLPSIINPIEGKLSSYASVNPTINFVVYIPPQEQSPLYIINKKGDLLATNAFLSPQWGGFMIKNVGPVPQNASLPYNVTLNMQEVMEVFLGQMKLLLGLPDMQNLKDSSVKTIHSAKCCDWELDYILRKSTQEQLSVAISSLYSLGQLLQTISNIVIRDDVGEKIYLAVASIKGSVKYLQQGFLDEAFIASKNAFNASEAAFFDPSLLTLLYFPEDQKYAIYIPLFLPVSIPVIMSLHQIWSHWFPGRRQKAKKD